MSPGRVARFGSEPGHLLSHVEGLSVMALTATTTFLKFGLPVDVEGGKVRI